MYLYILSSTFGVTLVGFFLLAVLSRRRDNDVPFYCAPVDELQSDE